LGHSHQRASSGTSGSGGSGGMRKVTAKRIGDIFWGDDDDSKPVGDTTVTPGNGTQAALVEVVPEETEEERNSGPKRQDSGVQVDDRDFESLPPSYDEDKKNAEVERQQELELERQLAESIEATKALAQTLKARLHVVEKQVDDLVKRAEEKGTQKPDSTPSSLALPPPAPPSNRTTPSNDDNRVQPAPGAKSTILSLLQRYVLRNDAGDPPSVRALPSYMLLVGIGMCAVVFRVVLRRVLTAGANSARR
jgi:hypothetical protein